MADLERMINIIFNGEDRTSGAFTSVTGSFNKLSTEVEAMAAPFARIADDVLKLDTALAAMAIGSLAYATIKAGEFGDATNKIATMIHDTTFDVNQYGDSILDYAVNSTQSIQQINAAIYEALSTGIKWEDALGRLSAAEKLAVAGDGELTSSLLLLTQTMNAYGAGLEETQRYSDAFFKTTELGVIKIPELASSFAQVGLSAANAGVPIETAGAALATMTSKGALTGEAITMLSGILRAIINPADGAEKAFEKLEIQYGESAIKAKGLEGIMIDIFNATNGNSDAIAKLFPRYEGYNGVMALVATDGGAKFLQFLDEMRDSAGATDIAYELMVNNIEYVNQRLVNTMQAAFITAGKPLLDDWSNLAAALGEVFKSLRISLNQGAFNDVYAMIEQFAAQFTAYVDGIAAALPEAFARVDFTGLTAAIKELLGSFSEYLGDLDLTKPEDLATALQKVIDVAKGLVLVTKGMVDEFRPYAEMIVDFFTKVANGDEEALESFGRFLTTAKLVASTGLELALAMNALQKAGVEWGAAFNLAVDSVKLGINLLQIGFEGFAYAATSALWVVLKALDSLTFHQSDTIQEGLKNVEAELARLAGDMVKNAHEGSAAFDGVIDSVKRMSEATGAAAEKSRALAEELRAFPESRFIDIQVNMNLAQLDAELASFTEARFIDIIPRVNEAAEAAEKAKMNEWASESRYIGIIPRVVPNAQATVDKALASKEIEWSAKLDIAKVEAQAGVLKEQLETIQNSVEWKAKLDIAEVEANATIISSAFDTMSAALTSSADIISSALGALSGDYGINSLQMWDRIFDVIDRELEIRDRAMDSSEALINKQIEYMEAKIRAMQKGDALIQIDGAGLQPHLEAFMWEILSAIQVRVNEEGHAMLFGM